MEPLHISSHVVVPADALSVKAVRSGGPGGQHVNKTATKIELRIDLDKIVGLSERQRRRLRARSRNRLDEDGQLVIVSQSTRSQRQNLEEALGRARTLIEDALPEPRRRIPTKPSRAAKARRVNEKRRQAQKKDRRRWQPE